MKKIILTKQIYELYQELERLKDTLNFAFPYSLGDVFISDDYMVGFYLNEDYYEVFKNRHNELRVFTNNITLRVKEVLTEEELEDLVNRLKNERH